MGVPCRDSPQFAFLSHILQKRDDLPDFRRGRGGQSGTIFFLDKPPKPLVVHIPDSHRDEYRRWCILSSDTIRITASRFAWRTARAAAPALDRERVIADLRPG